MGTHCSSELRRGHKGIIFIMKLLLLTALATIAAAEPWGYYGYHPVVGNSPTLQWPGYSGPGFSRQTFGLRGKRSAEPEPYYGYYGLYHPYGYYGLGRGVAGHAGGGVSYTHRSPQGIGKRSAEPEPHYGYYGLYHPYGYYGVGGGVAAHPTGGSSYVAPTTWGIGKRSAEEPEQALATHPNGGTSYVGQTVWGFPRSKRSAEPEPFYGYYGLYHPYAYGLRAYGPGVAAHPGAATSYTQRSPQGLRGKRSAEADAYYGYYGHQLSWPSVRAPGFSATTWGARPYGFYWG